MANNHVISVEVVADTAQAAAGIQNLGKVTSGLDSIVRKLTIGGLFGGTIATALSGFVQNSAEAQESSLKLERALGRLGAGADVTESQIESLAISIQGSSKFTDEAVKDAAGSLLLFDKVVGDTFERALTVSADLAAVMGTDIPQAAQQLGRALQLPGEGLRVLVQAGIKFSDDQVKLLQAMTETGHGAEAQAIILDELERRTKGAAKATSETLGGALTQLKNQIGDLLENESGVNAFTAAINHLNEALASNAKFRGPNGQLNNDRDRLANDAKRLESQIAEARAAGENREAGILQGRLETTRKVLADTERQLKNIELTTRDRVRGTKGGRDRAGTGAAVDNIFAGTSSDALADAQAEIDKKRNAATEKALAASLEKQRKLIQEWQDSLSDTDFAQAFIDDANFAALEKDLIRSKGFADDLAASISDIPLAGGDALADLARDSEKAIEAIRGPFDTFTDAFKAAGDAMVRTGKFSGQQFVNQLIAALLQKRLYDAIDKLGNALAGALGGGGSGTLGKIGASIGSFFFGGGKAGGGIIDRPTLVGEEGPEIAFPGRGGASIANLRQVAFGGGQQQQAAPVINYAPVYNVSGLDTQGVIAYFESTRAKDQKGMLTMLYNNGFGRMR